ncbi:MAG TPA: hypothetical protein VE863_22980 [Pyrinomonadaceae bacterium]|jgi:hypothetical protein|nr:hypothetical protein [Pyrinomonadaceae bacterium]
MITIRLWLNTLLTTFTNIGALVIFAIIYAALVVSSYFFVAKGVATVGQVVLTYVLMFLIPVLFFVYQAAIIGRVQAVKFQWRGIALNTLRFILGTIPLLLIAWLLYYLLNKLALRYPAPIISVQPATQGPAPLHWPSLIFASLKFVLLGVAFPLAAIHLWIEMAACNFRETLRGGAGLILNRMRRRFASAFSFESVIIYALGLIVFFILPYTVLYVPYTPKTNKADFAAFILRLLLTFIFTFVGWVVTVSALTKNAGDTSPSPSPDRSPAVVLEAAA